MTPPPSTTITGAALVARCLKAAGVERVFSLSGNQVLGLYDALADAQIGIVHTRHEGAAVHMADAWARLTGRPGVCLVTAGSGHANALGALSMAEAGESPVLLLSGHAPLARAGQGAFQEMDQDGLARPITRWSAVVRTAGDVPSMVARAFREAQAGRAGPVHLSLPVDVLGTPAPSAVPPSPADFTPDMVSPDPGQIAQVLEHLRRAARPLVVAGPAGARPGVHAPLSAFAAHTGIPFVVVDHPRGLTDPAIGRAAEVLARADAVLLFGKRQDYRIGYGGPPVVPAGCTLLQIDPWASEIGRHRPAAVAIAADLLPAAKQLLVQARELDWASRPWAAEARALINADAVPAAMHVPPDPPGHDAGLHPLHVFDALAVAADRRAARPITFVLDGGEFGQWARARLRVQPPQHLVNEPSGTIGFAVPFAIGARAARPDATIVAIAGDGAFGFYAMEFETAVRHRLPFLAVVGNDAAWSTERHLQLGRYGRAVATDLTPARYDRLAAALGAHGEHVAHLADLRPALDRALQAVDAGTPAVVDVRVRSDPSPAGEPPA